MEIQIDEREARVLGCLMEKQLATPEYYPLSLNALTNACNQKSNRDPVVAWDEKKTVRDNVYPYAPVTLKGFDLQAGGGWIIRRISCTSKSWPRCNPASR